MTEKQSRWLQQANHYLNESVSFDTIIELMQEDLNAYSKKANANLQLVREKQNIIYNLQRFQSYSLQTVNSCNDVIAELLFKNEELAAQVKNQNSLIEILNKKENE